MPQQILVIHGGDAFDSYEEYLRNLELKMAYLDRMKVGGWKMELQKNLGEGFDVYSPTMPNAANAKYAEWKIWFEKIIPLLNDDLILVGHSLGGIFLAKYLSENQIARRVRATFLVAAPFNTPTDHPLADFVLLENLAGLRKQGGDIFLYHSIDDVVVPFSNAQSYMSDLSDATLRSFTDRGHFNDDRLLEIEKDIQSVNNLVSTVT